MLNSPIWKMKVSVQVKPVWTHGFHSVATNLAMVRRGCFSNCVYNWPRWRSNSWINDGSPKRRFYSKSLVVDCFEIVSLMFLRDPLVITWAHKNHTKSRNYTTRWGCRPSRIAVGRGRSRTGRANWQQDAIEKHTTQQSPRVSSV